MKKHLDLTLVASILAASLLAACGGSDNAPASTISGTAATGAAISGGTVSLKCAAGTVTPATTGANGNYTMSVSGLTFPCVGRVDYKDSSGIAQKLHTFVSGLGVANITPVTELIVANLTGGTAASAFDNFDTLVKTKAFTASQLTAAAAAVKGYLKTLGVTVDDLPSDPIGTSLVATSGGVAGDKFDKVLDALGALLTKNGKKLSDVVADVSKLSGSANTAQAGYPASGTYAGKLSDGSACTIKVADDHTATASAASWAYTGSITANLDGTFYESTTSNQEIAPLVFYSGKSRFYEANAGDYAKASKAAPSYLVGMNFDSTSGKLIAAYGYATTDSTQATVGANFNFSCAGEAFPSGSTVVPSEFNKAVASNFKATSFVGTFNAPAATSAAGVFTACTIAVDSIGNVSLTSPNFTGGALVVPYTKIDTYSGAVNDVNNASYTLVSGPDTYVVYLRNQAGRRDAQVVINTSGSGTSSKGEKALTCSTANDPAPMLASYLTRAGTYKGVLSAVNFANKTSGACAVTISSAGVTTYTDSLGGVKSVTSNAANPPRITASTTYGTNYDLQPDGNFALTFDTPATLRDSSTNQLLGNRLFYANGGRTESCLQLALQP